MNLLASKCLFALLSGFRRNAVCRDFVLAPLAVGDSVMVQCYGETDSILRVLSPPYPLCQGLVGRLLASV